MNPWETGRATNVDPSSVETRDDFARFLGAVLHDVQVAGHDEWENATLVRFLDGFAAYASARMNTSLTGVSLEHQETASWRLFAELVRSATGYE